MAKTANSLFDNGVYAMEMVESTIKDCFPKHNRKYYKVGEGRTVITEDKVNALAETKKQIKK